MTRYSIEPRDRIFLKGYGFLSLDENKSKIVNKSVNKNSVKCTQKLHDHALQSAKDAFKTASKIVTQKTAEGTGEKFYFYFISNNNEN